MLSLPPEPNPGEPIKASLIRSLIQAIRSLRPIPGPGVRLSTGPNGTTFSVETKRQTTAAAAPAELHPWKVVGTTVGEGCDHLFEVYQPGFVSIGGHLMTASGLTLISGKSGWYKIDCEDDISSSGTFYVVVYLSESGDVLSLHTVVTTDPSAIASSAGYKATHLVVPIANVSVQDGNGTGDTGFVDLQRLKTEITYPEVFYW